MYRFNQGRYEDERLGITVTAPEGWHADLMETPELPALAGEEAVADAVLHPACGRSLQELAVSRHAKTASIIVSDATRGVPTAVMLKYVVQGLTDAGIKPGDIHVFVGIGVHRPATEQEMRDCLGSLAGKISIENHTPFDASNLTDLGSTSGGTPVLVNRRAHACDLHIQIGKVEPHEFAGFSGGRKSVLPGVSSERTIIINHRPDMILREKSAIGVLEGNPVHEDMLEAARLYRMDFGVNCVLNNRMQIAAVFAGDMEKCHAAACRYVSDKLKVELKAPDIIVTTPGLPLDIDFYQSVKALIALTEAVDARTKIVFYCGAPEGVNSPDMLRAFSSSENLEEVVAFTKKNYKIQMDHVLLLSKIFRKNVQVYASCDHVSDADLKHMFMIPCDSPQDALDKAVQSTGKRSGSILFYPRPQTGLPVRVN